MSGTRAGEQVGTRFVQFQAPPVPDENVQIRMAPHRASRLAEPIVVTEVDGLGKNDDPMVRIRVDDLLPVPLVTVQIAEISTAVTNENRLRGELREAKVVGMPTAQRPKAMSPPPTAPFPA